MIKKLHRCLVSELDEVSAHGNGFLVIGSHGREWWVGAQPESGCTKIRFAFYDYEFEWNDISSRMRNFQGIYTQEVWYEKPRSRGQQSSL